MMTLGQHAARELSHRAAGGGDGRFLGRDSRRQFGHGSAQLVDHLLGRLVTLGVDPGGVQRIVAADDFQESRRLNEGRFAESRHLLELVAAAERAMLLAVFVQSPCGQLVQPRDVAQQCRAGGIDVDSDEIHAGFHHRVQRILQVFRLDIVLIQPHADVGRIDLDQFRKRILQTAADRHGAAQDGVEPGQFFTTHRAGRVDAGPRFVDDDVVRLAMLQFVGDDIRDQFLGFTACRTVPDGDDRDVVHQDHFDHLLATAPHDVFFADHVDDRVAQHVAEFVQRRQFAAAAEPGVDGQNPAVVYGRLQQQFAQIPGKHLHRVQLGVIGQFAAYFPFQAGNDQPIEGVAEPSAQKFRMRMPRRDRNLFRFGQQRFGFHLDLDPQDFRTVPPIDRQQSVRRNLAERFLIVEIVLERFDLLFAFAFFRFFAGFRRQLLDRQFGRRLLFAATSPLAGLLGGRAGAGNTAGGRTIRLGCGLSRR